MVKDSGSDILYPQAQGDTSASAETSDTGHFSEVITVDAQHNVQGHSVADKSQNITLDSNVQGDNNTPSTEDSRSYPHEFYGVYYENGTGFATEEQYVSIYHSPQEYVSSEFTNTTIGDDTIVTIIKENKIDTNISNETAPSEQINQAIAPNIIESLDATSAPVQPFASNDSVNIKVAHHDDFTDYNLNFGQMGKVNLENSDVADKVLQNSDTPRSSDTDSNSATAKAADIIDIGDRVSHNINDAPVITPFTASIDESILDGTVVGNVIATDDDIIHGDTLNYSITGGNNGAFAIDPNTGQVTVADASKIVSESAGSHTLQVTVTDSSGATDVQNITINVADYYTEIAGNSGNNSLIGNTANERFMAGDGNDTVYGFGGNDAIYGEGGTDVLVGDTSMLINAANPAGDDFISGGDGNDTIVGDGVYYVMGNGVVSGDDTLMGDAGNDFMLGDSLFYVSSGATGGDDSMYGGDGNDTIYGDSYYSINTGSAGGDDTIYGGDGNDIISGDTGFFIDATSTGGDDTIFGGEGNDTIYGDALNDGGNGGDDIIDGGAGVDTIYAGSGDDTIMFDQYDALVSGGAGSDTLVLSGSTVDLTQFSNISGIDNLSWSDVVDNGTVSLDYNTVVQISDNKTITIEGDAGDIINLTDGNWSQGGIENGYQVYNNSDVKILVDLDIDNSSGVNLF